MSYSPIHPLQRQMPAAWAAALQSHSFDVVGTLDYKGGTNRQAALEAAMVFWSRVDRLVFGSAQVQRHGVRLHRVCFFEHGHNRRPTDHEVKLASSHAAETRNPNWHYHFYVRGGGRYPSAHELVSLLKTQWARIHEAGFRGIVEPLDPEKGSWGGYLCWKSQGWCELTSTCLGNATSSAAPWDTAEGVTTISA